jgi:hypothetical protein
MPLLKHRSPQAANLLRVFSDHEPAKVTLPLLDNRGYYAGRRTRDTNSGETFIGSDLDKGQMRNPPSINREICDLHELMILSRRSVFQALTSGTFVVQATGIKGLATQINR